jgi:transposase InsO family protein
VNVKRVRRLWNELGLRRPPRRKKPRKLGPKPGSSANSCVQQPAQFKNDVWTYDFLADRTVLAVPYFFHAGQSRTSRAPSQLMFMATAPRVTTRELGGPNAGTPTLFPQLGDDYFLYPPPPQQWTRTQRQPNPSGV